MTQYTNESLFDVISMIANNEIAKLNFDITLICTIVDNSRSSMGWYTVTDGSVRFDAYSEDTKLKNKDSVRVQVPRGDMSGRKYILGKTAAEDTNKPVSYISPSERIVDLTSNLYTNTQEVKFLANSKITEIQLEEVDISSKNIDTNIYDIINLGFDVKTQFINTSLSKGNYGVILAVAYESKIKEKSLEYRRYVLDSQEFLGNPYSFLLTERQEVLFKIGLPDHRVTEIQLGCYQKNNFSYINSSGDYTLINENPVEGFYDIILSNFYVSFGNELSKIEDNTVKITTFDDTVYEIGGTSAQPKCNITWYNKDENNKYIGFSDGRPIITNNHIDIENHYSEFEYLKLNSYYSDIEYNSNFRFPMDKNGLEMEKEYVEAKDKISQIIKNRESILKEMENTQNKLGETNKHSDLDTLIGGFETVSESLSNSFNLLITGAAGDNPFEGLGYYWNKIYQKFVSKKISFFGELTTNTVYFYVNSFKDALQNTYNDLGYVKNIEATTEQLLEINNLKTKVNDSINESQALIQELQSGVFGDNFEIMRSTINAYANDYNYTDYQEYAANRYNIYWYRANNQEIAPDPFGGTGWTRISDLDNKGLPTGKDYTKVGEEYLYTKLPSDIEGVSAQITFTDSYAAFEKIKAVIIYNHNYYVSNILEFENKSPTVDKTTLLTIQHGKLSRDMFQIYGDDYQIVNQIETQRNRELKPKVNLEDFDWLNSKITWKIPIVQSQLIRFDEAMTTDKGYIQNINNRIVEYTLTITDNCYKENEEKEKVLDEQFLTLVYGVSGHFSPKNTNNTIICEVVLPNGEAITAEKAINFAAFGTNGSKYNLFFEPLNGYQYPIIPSSKEGTLTIAPRLYDIDGNEVSFTANDIKVEDIDISKVEAKIDEISGNITFQLKKQQTEYYLVPKISMLVSVIPAEKTQTIGENIQVRLVKQYPIAIGHYYQYEGISKVVYNVLGSDPRYYSGSCYLYDIETNVQQNCSCELKDLETESKDTSLKLITTQNNEYSVSAANMYIKTEKSPKWVLLFKDSNNTVFCQPIPIMQDNFTSRLLNDWDGGTKVGDDTIMSNLVGAGSKNADGKFSGVLMGEVERAYDGQLELKHGLFGYQNNNLNFQLTVDGVLKLGNNTSGTQLIFDGSSSGGTIMSNNYLLELNKGVESPTVGMKIDLANGHIDAYNFKLKSGKILIDSNPATNGDYFSITDGANGYGKIFSVSTGNKAGIYMAGWKIDNNSIRYGELGRITKVEGANGEIIDIHGMWLCSSGTNTSTSYTPDNTSKTYTDLNGNTYKGPPSALKETDRVIGIAPPNTNGWVITAGQNFGVTKDGNLYASNAILEGVITATKGEIGGWIVDGNILKSKAQTTGLNGENIPFLLLDGGSGNIISNASFSEFTYIPSNLNEVLGTLESEGTVTNTVETNRVLALSFNSRGQVEMGSPIMYGPRIYYDAIFDEKGKIVFERDDYKIDAKYNSGWGPAWLNDQPPGYCKNISIYVTQQARKISGEYKPFIETILWFDFLTQSVFSKDSTTIKECHCRYGIKFSPGHYNMDPDPKFSIVQTFDPI